VRRRAIPEVAGALLARVTLRAPGAERGADLNARSELVPADQRPGAFAGYTSQIQAVLRGREASTISVVVRDSDGRFHVFDTGLPPFPAQAPDGDRWHHSLSSLARQGSFEMVRPVRLFAEDGVDFDEAREGANAQQSAAGQSGLTADYTRAEAGYERELRAVVGNDVAVGHRRTDSEGGNHDTPGAEVLVDTQPANTDPALANAGIGHMPADRGSPDPEVHHPVFTRVGLQHRTRNQVEQTLIHEATHEAHAERSLSLRHRWQASGGGMAFADWVQREAHAGRVSTEDAYVALQATHGETSGTEIMARVEAFTSTFTRASADDEGAFTQLATLAGYWMPAQATEAEVQPIRQLALDRLFHFYSQGIDEAHRQAFDRWVAVPAHFGGGQNDEQLTARGRALLQPALAGFRARLPH
jgi:hypothetical protein